MAETKRMNQIKQILLQIILWSRAITNDSKDSEKVPLNLERIKFDYDYDKCLKAARNLKSVYYKIYFEDIPPQKYQQKVNNFFKQYCHGYENFLFNETLDFIRAMGWLHGSKVSGPGKPCYDYFLKLKNIAKQERKMTTWNFSHNEKQEIQAKCFKPIKRKKEWYRQIIFAIENFF